MNFLNRNKTSIIILIVFLFNVMIVEESHAFFSKETYDCHAEENKNVIPTIELKLAKKKYRKKKREIKKTVQSLNRDWKVRLQFFPFLDPPMILGVGKCVSAEDGRLAIKQAQKYNRGIDRVVMQEFMPHHWIKIGVTDLAELTFIDISPEDLARLSDPALSTPEFQTLYREFSALRERKLPFGLGNRKIDVPPSK